MQKKRNELEYFSNRYNIFERQFKQLKGDYAQIKVENAQLKEENTSLKDTVSALAARNIKVKTETSDKPRKNKKSEYQMCSRPRPEQVDEKKVIEQKDCNVCGKEISKPTDTYSRTVEEIVPAKTVITRIHITRRYCKHCKKQISGKVSNVLPNERFGLRLMVLIISLKTMGLSHDIISQLLQMLYSLNLTESTINNAVKYCKGIWQKISRNDLRAKKKRQTYTATRRAGG